MNANTTRRITAEFKQFNEEIPPGISVSLIETNMMTWRATIMGPEDTPYHGGVFDLDVTFPPEYPFKPPKVTFRTQIYHPNVSGAGSICLDILSSNWSPALTTPKCLLSIRHLMMEPNPHDPLNNEAASLFRSNRQQYDNTAREKTRQYAQGV